MPQRPLRQAVAAKPLPVYMHLISRLPCSAAPSLNLAAGDVRGGGHMEKEAQPTAAHLEPWEGLGILLCLSSENYVQGRHLTLTASWKCF